MKSVNLTLVVLWMALIISCTNTSEEDTPPIGLEDSLNVYLQKVMKRFRIPGMTIAIIQDGKPLYINAFGVINIDTKKK